MEAYNIFLLISFTVLADSIDNDSVEVSRDKRNTAGILDILTNHAQPIHADVNLEGANDITEKPCDNNKNLPSPIEPGIVFQVLPPNDTTLYGRKSLRKSLPLTNKLDAIRSVTRITTLVVLIVSAVLEFYPMLQFLYYIVYNFIYVK